MGLHIRFQGGPLAGQTVQYDDSVNLVTFGRDRRRCQVVFPAEETQVGREHCALKRVLGRWRLVVNGDNLVLIDGEPAHDDQELAAVADLQLGPKGPRLIIQTTLHEELPPTDIGLRRPPSKRAHLGEVLATARRAKIIAAVGLGLALGVWIWGWLAKSELTEKVQVNNVAVKQLTERQKSQIAELSGKIRDVEREHAGSGKSLADALTKAAGSVYLVAVKDASGRVDPQATAWVVRPGVLATNAHVAMLFTPASMLGMKLFVRSNAVPPVDHEVTRVDIHPGFEEFERVRQSYKPLFESADGSKAELNFVPACDVALLYVENAGKLAAPLPTSAADELGKLRSGEPVGFIGYPMEGMISRGVNPNQPSPQTQLGHLTAITDFFFAKDAAKGQLLHHSLPATGGASGSPILNDEGKVVGVLSAGNLVMTPGGRIPLAVGVNFAQRIDLVRELLDGKADGLQAARVQGWQEGIKQFPSARIDPAAVIARLLKDWTEDLGGGAGGGRVETERVDEEAGTLATPGVNGGFLSVLRVDALPAGDYLIAAVASDAVDIDMGVYDAGGGLLRANEADDACPSVRLRFDGRTSIEAAVIGAVPDAAFTFYVYRAARR